MSTRARSRVAVRIGGWALIAAAIGFVAVFGYLAVRFNYPDVLDDNAADVLPSLLAMGRTGRAVWSVYGILPLLLIPAAIGVSALLLPRAPGLAAAAIVTASLSAMAMLLGLMRWPSIMYSLAEALSITGDMAERKAIGYVFDGLNMYLGNVIGEFVGELLLNVFFIVTAIGLRTTPRVPRWSAHVGIVVGVAGLIGMWRNVTPTVAIVADIENSLLPLWLLVLGVLLVRAASQPDVLPAMSPHAHRAALEPQ